MADSEWFCVETSGGTQLPKPGELPPQTRFPNRETAADVAKTASPQYDGVLTVVKYTRKEVRTFQRKVTVDEADLPA
jgi:hypothetical protein